MVDPSVAAYRDRFRVVEEIEGNEQRAASLDERWKQLNAILAMALALGLKLDTPDPEEDSIRRRWARIRAKT